MAQWKKKILEARDSNPCKCAEMRGLFVSSSLTIAVKLHNFTAFYRQIMYEICVKKNFSPPILHIFPIFPQPGWSFWNPCQDSNMCDQQLSGVVDLIL